MTDDTAYELTCEPIVAIAELTAYLNAQACHIREFCEINSASREALLKHHSLEKHNDLSDATVTGTLPAQAYTDTERKNQTLEYNQAVSDFTGSIENLTGCILVMLAVVRSSLHASK